MRINRDTDGDGLIDELELAQGTDWMDPDTDNDDLPDYWELTHFASLATMSELTDSDGDGRSDRDEWLEATLPNDPGESPRRSVF